MHSIVRGTGTPKDRDEVNRRDVTRRVLDEVFDGFFLGILDLAEDGVTTAKLVGLGNTTKLSKLLIFKVLNEDDFDFPFETSNSNQPAVKSAQNL